MTRWRRACVRLAAALLVCAAAPCFAGTVGGAGGAGVAGSAAARERAAVDRVGGARSAATLRVGPTRAIRSLAEAARRARDGDVIEVDPGEYRAPSAVWTQNDLLIRGPRAQPGDAPRAVMVADGASAEGKAIWVVRGGRVRIEDIEFRGARVAAGNGAGIRYERGQLTVERCAFFDNEMGILTAGSEQMTLTIRDSAFGAAPRHAGLLHHLLYVGAIGRFELVGSRLGNGYRGHLVKSRARENHVRYNLLVDGDEGSASYELEFPDGGLAYVVGNVIGQSRNSDNAAIVAYGAEHPRWPRNGLYLAHNTLLNPKPSGIPLKTWPSHFADGFELWLINNLVVGYGLLPLPESGRQAGNRTLAPGELIVDHGLPLRLRRDVVAPQTGVGAGEINGIDLSPAEEFSFPLGRRPRVGGPPASPGAFQ